ncbi:hypothetical protein P167DRAFT_567816 [Morchella conica CCBAS932]|uniref:Uncharacterized protein n=1 Tax=Morchella conica CCBAS932 TaxID=1392247 RepID=A0A3N4KDH3_9PEZI|nr:hypothetical protein P167DRAFT_567816 [Morchella conica CCBAS932]
MVNHNPNTINAPFPRTLTTTNANRRTTTTARSMGPPPPQGRNINERFDRMVYTSPLPRSISREYNNLRASTAAASTTITATATTITATASIPSSLRNETTSSLTPKKTTPKPPPPPPPQQQTARGITPRSRPARGSRTPVTATPVTTDSEDPLSAPGASTIVSPAPPKRQLVYTDVNIDVGSRGGSTEEGQGQEQPPKKRARSDSRTPMGPSKVRKTTTATPLGDASAGRTMRSSGRKDVQSGVKTVEEKTPVQRRGGGARRTTELVVAPASPARVAPATPNVSEPEPQLEEPEPQLEESEPEPEPVPVPVLPMKTNTAATPAPKSAKNKISKAILPGFAIPPGMLDQTGSLWDHGRRISRRNTIASAAPGFSLQSAAPVTTTKKTKKTTRKSLPSHAPKYNTARPYRAGKVPSRRSTAASDSDAPVPPGSIGGSGNGRKRRVDVLGASTDGGEELEKVEDVVKPKRATSTWKLEQMRKARELRTASKGSSEAEMEEGKMDRLLSAGIEDRAVEETPGEKPLMGEIPEVLGKAVKGKGVNKIPGKVPGKTPGKAPGKTPGKTPGKKAKAKGVEETPAPKSTGKKTPVGRRLTRGSAVKRPVNPEFEFSDED